MKRGAGAVGGPASGVPLGIGLLALLLVGPELVLGARESLE